MRIALTYNLRRSDAPEESEFDTQETIDALAVMIEHHGHRVEQVEVLGGSADTIERLRSIRPDLVFNQAEGRPGPLREALLPAVLEEHGFACTGSPPRALATTLDKWITKLVVAAEGMPTPRARFVRDAHDLPRLDELGLPVIVKPNFEGSSIGVTQDAIVLDAARLGPTVADVLAAHPAGVLVEQFIDGHDVTVPFIEGVGDHGGVLDPVEYVFQRSPGRYRIYDYSLKNVDYDLVDVRVPARLDPGGAAQLRLLAEVAYAALGVRDMGRADFRCDPEGGLHFLEMNAIPSLERGAGIYAAAALHGLDEVGVIGAIVGSATRRHGLTGPTRAA